MTEATISTETIYKGKIINLERLQVHLPNGRQATREVVRHPGAVGILVEPKPDYIVLVEQFRKPLDRLLLEIPAGKLEPGEDPESCAVRELQEETGYGAERVQLIHSFFTSPGFADEQIHVYYADDVVTGRQSLDEDEFVDAQLYSIQEIQTKLAEGCIQDAKTLVALLWWLNKKVAK